ncbi:MAG: hypothetical protein ACE5E1_10420 [Phycisphaerae bacterium]
MKPETRAMASSVSWWSWFGARWRWRVINLDDPRIEKLKELYSTQEPSDSTPCIRNPVWTMFLFILKQCMLDGALFLHAFGCVLRSLWHRRLGGADTGGTPVPQRGSMTVQAALM